MVVAVWSCCSGGEGGRKRGVVSVARFGDMRGRTDRAGGCRSPPTLTERERGGRAKVVGGGDQRPRRPFRDSDIR